MKHLTIFVFSLAVCAAVCSGAQSGNAVDYAYNPRTRVLTMSGGGLMNNYTKGSLPWQEFVDEILEVVIEAGVTSIGKYFCYECSALKKVTVEGTLKGIFDYAFYHCKELETVIIHDLDGSIGPFTFSNCSSLTNLTFEGRRGIIRSLGCEAFYGCYSLVEVNFPRFNGYLDTFVFCGCTNLTSVSIKGTIDYIGEDVFTGCTSLTDLTLSGLSGTLADNAFTRCTSLSTVTIDGRLESLSPFSKSYIKALTKVKFGSVKTMSSFSGNKELTSFIIDKLDSGIVNDAFKGCTKLTTVKIGAGSGTNKPINARAFYGCSSLKEIVIPSSIRDLFSDVFANCTSLVKVYIPGTVTYVGSRVFADCPALTDVRYEGVKDIDSYTDDVFLRSDKLDKVSVPLDYSNDTFCGKPVEKKEPDPPASSSESSSSARPTSSSARPTSSSARPTSSSARPTSSSATPTSSHSPRASSSVSAGEKNTVGILAVFVAICLLLI